MAKAFRDSKITEKFETVPLFSQTLRRRVTDMGEEVRETLLDMVEKNSYFSLCLDESTDNIDVSQSLIFIPITHEDFSLKEELFNMCALHEATKEKDIYGACRKIFA